MFIKRDLVMLPTNKKSNLYLDGYKKLNLFPIVDELNSNKQHIYILSDEEIKEGDWFIDLRSKQEDLYWEDIYCAGSGGTAEFANKIGKKIIATTDKSLNANRAEDSKLNVEYIPQSFIEYFVSEYNKGNIITEVMVEYENINKNSCLGECGLCDNSCKPIYKLKINQDNTINIKPIKISKYEDLYKAIDKIKEGHKGSAINFIERFINTQID